MRDEESRYNVDIMVRTFESRRGSPQVHDRRSILSGRCPMPYQSPSQRRGLRRLSTVVERKSEEVLPELNSDVVEPPKVKKRNTCGTFVNELAEGFDALNDEEKDFEHGTSGEEGEEMISDSSDDDDEHATPSGIDDSVMSLRRKSSIRSVIEVAARTADYALGSSEDSIIDVLPRNFGRRGSINNRITRHTNTTSLPSISSQLKGLQDSYQAPTPELPPIRRIIAQDSTSFRVEYYPSWIPRTHLTPAVLNEWTYLAQNSENVLSYNPINKSGTSKNTSTTWTVLRNEVPSDNDSGASMAHMLHETVTRAIHELGNQNLANVLAAPYEWVSGSRAKAARLMGRHNVQNLDVGTFLTHLATKTSTRERRRFSSIKLRYMGQIDSRVTQTAGRTHTVSAVALLASVMPGYQNPLAAWQAHSFFRDSAHDPDFPAPSSSKHIKPSTSALSEYNTLLLWRSTLLTLLHSSPHLFTSTSYLLGLAWLLFPRRTLKRLFLSWGIHLPSDWHTYVREVFLCRYYEDVGDERGWHDGMETSLFLNGYFKGLRAAEEGIAESDDTDRGGDSDEDCEEDLGVGTVVTKGAVAGVKGGKGRKRKRGVSEDDGNDGGFMEIDASTDEESEEDHLLSHGDEHGHGVASSSTKKTPERKHLPRKSRSSKAPRRAQMMDPDGMATKKAKTGSKKVAKSRWA